MTPETVIVLTLIGYKIVLLSFGLIGQRRTSDSVDYFLGGRSLGPMVAAISASASSSSAWTLLGVSGAAYATGLSALWIFPSCVGGFLLNWYVLAPALRRVSRESGAVTMTEVIAGPVGRPWRRAVTIAASVIILLSLGSYVATQFQGAGKTFAETFEMSKQSSILIGAAIVVLYTMMGGFWAVSLTDTLQGLLMAAVSLLLPIAALVHVGGPGGLIADLREVPVDGFLDPWKHAPVFGSIGFVLGYFGIGLGYPGQPHVVNRFMALGGKPGAVATARRIAISWSVVVYAGMLLLGLCGRALHPALGDGEVILVVLANDLFPPVLAGVILAAVLSAIMSTADSQLLVAASSVTHDLDPSAGTRPQKSLVRRSRVVVLALSLGAVAAALFVTESIFSWVLFAWSAMGCAFGPLLLVTVLRGPVPAGRALTAILLGFTLSVLAYLGPQFGLPTKGGVFDRVLPFLVALAVALLPGRRDDR